MISSKLSKKGAEYIYNSIEIIGSISAGLVIGYMILAVLGFNPVSGLYYLLLGGVGNIDYLLSRATLIMMTGLAFAIPMLSGLFNIGGEGQMYIGGFIALLTAFYFKNLPLALMLGGLMGSFIGFLIGALKVIRGVNEVVSAIMLNWIFYYLIMFFITNIYYDPIAPHESVKVPRQIRLGVIKLIGMNIHTIFFLSLAFIMIAYYLLYHTKLGYEIRITGVSPRSAKYAGVNPEKITIWSMTLGGFFGGLSGALNVLGFTYYIDSLLTTMFGIGFDGIGVALMGRNNPIGIIFSSIFFSMLILGGQTMQITLNAPKEVADALSGVIIITLSLPYAYRLLLSHFKVRRLARGDRRSI